MKKVQEVNTTEMGLEVLNTRTTRAEGILLEVDDPEADDRLAGKSTISLRTNPGGRYTWVDRFDVTYPATLMLAGAGHVMVGWTRCRVKLRRTRPVSTANRRTISWQNAKARPCPAEGHLAVACSGPEKNKRKQKNTTTPGPQQ